MSCLICVNICSLNSEYSSSSIVILCSSALLRRTSFFSQKLMQAFLIARNSQGLASSIGTRTSRNYKTPPAQCLLYRSLNLQKLKHTVTSVVSICYITDQITLYPYHCGAKIFAIFTIIFYFSKVTLVHRICPPKGGFIFEILILAYCN